MDETNCHVHSLRTMQRPLGTLETLQQLGIRLRRGSRRRVAYLENLMRRRSERPAVAPVTTLVGDAPALQRGERVRVRSREEIRRTLDDWNMLRGCAFMNEMWSYCGTEQVVFKQVVRFLDERDYKVKRIQHTYQLENVLCSGSDFGPCDRSCFFFWRDEWLERID